MPDPLPGDKSKIFKTPRFENEAAAPQSRIECVLSTWLNRAMLLLPGFL